MAKRITDKELEEYKKLIGAENYRRSYELLYLHAKKVQRRFSGKNYKNSSEKIAGLKDKYKNGVTAEIMKEFENSL